jgi:hypothetical protein
MGVGTGTPGRPLQTPNISSSAIMKKKCACECYSVCVCVCGANMWTHRESRTPKELY